MPRLPKKKSSMKKASSKKKVTFKAKAKAVPVRRASYTRYKKPYKPKSINGTSEYVFGRSNVMARDRAIDFFNPLNDANREKCVNISGSLGNFIGIIGRQRLSVGISTSVSPDQYFIQLFTASNLAFMHMNSSSRNLGLILQNELFGTQIETVRPSRMAISLSNITSNLNREGSVSIVSLSTPLTWLFEPWITGAGNVQVTAGFVASLASICDNHPRVLNLTHTDVSIKKDFVGLPCSSSAYSQFSDYVELPNTSPLSAIQHASIISVLTDAEASQAMSVTIIRVRNTSVNQTYEVFSAIQNGYKVSENILLSRLQHSNHGPPLSVPVIESMAAAASSVAGVMAAPLPGVS